MLVVRSIMIRAAVLNGIFRRIFGFLSSFVSRIRRRRGCRRLSCVLCSFRSLFGRILGCVLGGLSGIFSVFFCVLGCVFGRLGRILAAFSVA